MHPQTIDHRPIIDSLNKCFLEYADWPRGAGDEAVMNAFRYHVEREAGLRITFAPKLDPYGRHGYEVITAELVDEQQYLVWTLKWT